MADPTRLELATSAVTGQRSNQLSYESTLRVLYPNSLFLAIVFYNPPPAPQNKNGADGRVRTCDLLVTNELLYQLSYIGTCFIITYMCYNKNS